MRPLIRLTRHTLQLVLLLSLLSYTLLPVWDAAWHDAVPEHDHWLWGVTPVSHAPISEPDQTYPSVEMCRECASDTSLTLIHTFNPLSALQLFVLVMLLTDSLMLRVPDSVTARLPVLALLLTSSDLSLLDPPPRIA